MWLLDAMSKKENTQSAEQGTVTQYNSGKTDVYTSNFFKEIALCAPYGILFAPPQGEKAVVLPLADQAVCLGTISEKETVQPGELLLYSKGGAKILLSNDGKVYINGKEF